MSEKHVYKTGVKWLEKRKGILSSPGLPDITVATPPEFPEGHPDIWSPEHLFVAAAEVCTMTTFLAIAASSKLEFLEYRSEAEGILEKLDTGYQVTHIYLRPTVVVASEASVDKAKRLLEKSEKHCLIANSMKTEVHLEPNIVVRGS